MVNIARVLGFLKPRLFGLDKPVWSSVFMVITHLLSHAGYTGSGRRARSAHMRVCGSSTQHSTPHNLPLTTRGNLYIMLIVYFWHHPHLPHNIRVTALVKLDPSI